MPARAATDHQDRFNRWMDELIVRAIAQDPVSSEFRQEYVKLMNLLKRVAEFDPGLASEIWLSAMMLGYNFAVGVVKKVVSR